MPPFTISALQPQRVISLPRTDNRQPMTAASVQVVPHSRVAPAT
jgi:hypothetical protein